jgi:catalase
VIAPKIGGATLSDRKKVPARQKIDGGPSVLYDAVALIVSDKGADLLAGDGPTRDFISDAFAHCKFIAYSKPAASLLAMAGVLDKADAGFFPLGGKITAGAFIKACRALRFWDREPAADMDAR